MIRELRVFAPTVLFVPSLLFIHEAALDLQSKISPSGLPALVALADAWCGEPYIEDSYDYGYPESEYDDAGGECLFPVNGEQENSASEAIDEICTGFLCPECSSIKYALLNSTTWYEWTGWSMDGGYWNIGRWWPGGHIGIHWDWMDSAWLWAHEGAHEALSAGETEANYFAAACTSM